jgi:hypothetical protein
MRAIGFIRSFMAPVAAATAERKRRREQTFSTAVIWLSISSCQKPKGWVFCAKHHLGPRARNKVKRCSLPCLRLAVCSAAALALSAELL